MAQRFLKLCVCHVFEGKCEESTDIPVILRESLLRHCECLCVCEKGKAFEKYTLWECPQDGIKDVCCTHSRVWFLHSYFPVRNGSSFKRVSFLVFLNFLLEHSFLHQNKNINSVSLASFAFSLLCSFSMSLLLNATWLATKNLICFCVNSLLSLNGDISTSLPGFLECLTAFGYPYVMYLFIHLSPAWTKKKKM